MKHVSLQLQRLQLPLSKALWAISNWQYQFTTEEEEEEEAGGGEGWGGGGGDFYNGQTLKILSLVSQLAS